MTNFDFRIPAQALEFEAVLKLFGERIESSLGRGRLSALAFLTDRRELERQQRFTAEAIALAAAGETFRFSGVQDPRPVLARAAIEGLALDPAEILAVIGFVERASALRQFLAVPIALSKDGVSRSLPQLADVATGIADFHGLLREVRSKLLPNGELDDNASPELARLRRDIEKQRRTISQSLERQLRELGGEGVLREQLITIRGERLVLPVKAEDRRRVAGVVHGASSSGQTLYVEPLESIELNNDLVRLLEQEQEEVRRILALLTARLRELGPPIARAAESYAELEFQLAKGRFAAEFGGVAADFSGGAPAPLDLQDVRHPLLVATLKESGREVVPLSLALEDRRIVIVSGPNTGGKTVALKTVGVAALMAQTGLPVCAGSARLPIFDRVLADIGDLQSLRESLSTFSSHIVNLRSILGAVTAYSLVLLDELGAATDPGEGAALAIAIVEHLLRAGATALISTHHGALKSFAATDEGIVNASVGFDRETLLPTYRFRTGIPGLSAGLQMARQLGLQQEMVEAAQARLSDVERRSGELLRDLEQRLAETEALNASLEQERQQLRRREAQVENEDKRERQRKLADFDRRFEELVRQFEARMREATDAVQEKTARARREREAGRAAAGLRREAREAFRAEVVQHLAGIPAEAAPGAPVNVKAGDRVRLRDFSRPGRVLTRDGERIEVEAGNVRMRLRLEDILEVLPAEAAPARSAGVQVHAATLEPAALREIVLIGEKSDEALRRLEKFLDNALLAEIPSVRIVHGSGMGVLRKLVADTLSKNPHIARFYHPPQNEGGGGVTIAEMKT
jgi:DNA mismatch repair protein MutS2